MAEEHTVVLEVQQSPNKPGLLGLRVCDDGVPLPAERRYLERCIAALGVAPLLRLPLFADNSLLAQTTGIEEVVVRRYSILPTPSVEGSDCLAVADAGAGPKPPGSGLRGSVFEATIQLQTVQPGDTNLHGSSGAGSGGEDARAYVQQLFAEGAGAGEAAGGSSREQQPLPRSADEVVSCLQQVLRMTCTLGLSACLLMRLNGVGLKSSDGSVHSVSGSRRFDLELGPGLSPLQRFSAGVAAEHLPPPAHTPGQHQPLISEHTTAVARTQQRSARSSPQERSGQAEELAGSAEEAAPMRDARGALRAPAAAPTSPAAAAVAVSAAAGEAPQEHGRPAAELVIEQEPPHLMFLGVGEAGWGCPGAAQAFRGCKWTARAAMVLRMPDHARLAATAAAGAAAAAQTLAGATASQAGGPQPSLLGAVPVFVFRSWRLLFGGQQQAAALKGIERCEWGEHGFVLEHAAAGPDGPLAVALRCARPESGAAITAAVVHLAPSDYNAAAQGRQPPGLSAGYEARLVRTALEAALDQLKQQCPAVVSSRRERSLARALPLIGRSLADILLQSQHSGQESGGGGADEEGSVLSDACATLDCPTEGLEAAIGELLQQVVGAAKCRADAASGDNGGSIAKRPRQQGGGGREDADEQTQGGAEPYA